MNDDGKSTPSTSLTRSFIERRASSFHEAFGMDTTYDPDTSEYEVTAVANLRDALLSLSGERFVQDEFGYDIVHATWHDVVRECEKARAAAAKSDADGKKWWKKAWRVAGTTLPEHALAVFEAFPDELGVLHGGLAVIFTIARQRAQCRAQILDAFEDIPLLAMMAHDKENSLPHDHPRSLMLRQSVRALQRTLLAVLPDLIELLNPGTFRKRFMSPFRGANIDSLLSYVRKDSDKVRSVAESILDSITVDTHDHVRHIHEQTAHAGNRVDSLHEKIDEMLRQQKGLEMAFEVASSKTNLMRFLEEYIKPGYIEPLLRPGSPQSTVPPEYEPAIPVTPRQIFELMDVDHLASNDVEAHVLRSNHQMEKSAVTQAEKMFHTPQVSRLLRRPESGVVLVHGCSDRAQHGRMAPISYACASLALALRRAPENRIVLTFFCGHHTTSNDTLTGPAGLVRSMIAFLVLAMIQNKYLTADERIWFPNVSAELQEMSFTDICQVFTHLVEILPPGCDIYCIIDGISYYEREAYEPDFDIMMRCFGSLVTKESLRARIRMLLTSPGVSRFANVLEPHQRVSLRAHLT